MTDAVLGIDVSKNTLDTSLLAGAKPRSRSFANSSEGWRQLIAWLAKEKVRQVHACLEATGRYSLGIALALHEAGHVVSLVNPAQIRDFARTKLGRNKTDPVDAAHIREYAELFNPRPWTPAVAGPAAAVRTPDDPGRHGRQPDGMDEPQHQRPGGRQGAVAGQGDDPALHTRGSRPGHRADNRRRPGAVRQARPAG